jgi:hypothetical protein
VTHQIEPIGKTLRSIIKASLSPLAKLIAVVGLCSIGQTLNADPLKTHTIHSKKGGHEQHVRQTHYGTHQHQLNNARVDQRYSPGNRYKSRRFTTRRHDRRHQTSHNRYYNRHTDSYDNVYNNDHRNRNKNNGHAKNQSNHNKRYRESSNALVVVPLWVSAPNTGKVFQLPTQP